jgi:hypothetical protein
MGRGKLSVMDGGGGRRRWEEEQRADRETCERVEGNEPGLGSGKESFF